MNIQNIDLAILFGQGPVGVIGVLSITIINYMCTLCTGRSITWPTDWALLPSVLSSLISRNLGPRVYTPPGVHLSGLDSLTLSLQTGSNFATNCNHTYKQTTHTRNPVLI